MGDGLLTAALPNLRVSTPAMAVLGRVDSVLRSLGEVKAQARSPSAQDRSAMTNVQWFGL